MVRAPGEPRAFIVVAGAGTDPDLIGRRVHASGLGAVAAAPFLTGLRNAVHCASVAGTSSESSNRQKWSCCVSSACSRERP